MAKSQSKEEIVNVTFSNKTGTRKVDITLTITGDYENIEARAVFNPTLHKDSKEPYAILACNFLKHLI